MNYFREYMRSVPNGEYCSIKNKIITKCHISDEIWRNWLNGRTAVPKLAKPIIEEIAGRKIFEIDFIEE